MAKRRTSSKSSAAKRATPATRKAAKATKKAAPRKTASKAAKSKSTKTKAVKSKSVKKKTRTSKVQGTPAPDVLDLKALRRDIERAVAVLASRGGGASDGSARLASTQSVMSSWVSDIDSICEPEMEEICGPTMLIPLA